MNGDMRKEILHHIHHAWRNDPTTLACEMLFETTTEVSKPNKVDEVSKLVPWARLTLRHTTNNQYTLGSQNGKRKYIQKGYVIVQLFGPKKSGVQVNDFMVNVLVGATRGKSTDNVTFTKTEAREIGTDGSWYQTNVTIQFEYCGVE